MSPHTSLPTYQPSNKVDFPKFLLSIAFAIGASLILGYAYGVLVYFIPFPYINFFLTLALALALGFVFNKTVNLGHVRSKQAALFLALLIAVLGYTSHWSAYLGSAFLDSLPGLGLFLSLLASPLEMMSTIKAINQTGVWSIGSLSNDGFFGAFIYILEAGIILGLPLLSFLGRKVIPYNDTLKRFYDELKVSGDFELNSSPEEFAHSLVTSEAVQLWNHVRPATQTAFYRFKLYFLEQAEDQYLDLVLTKVELNDKGEQEETERVIIDNLKITKSLATYLKTEFADRLTLLLPGGQVEEPAVGE